MTRLISDSVEQLMRIEITRRTWLKQSLSVAGALGAGLRGGHAVAQTSGASGPVIETRFGKVRGLSSAGVQAFKGIPYGASTAGKMRFMPPVAPAPWTGVRDALQYGPPAPQDVEGQGLADKEFQAALAAGAGNSFGELLLGPGTMGEDCLVLNVWTASTDSTRRRPVMFWIHGGGYTAGSGGRTWFDGSNLARKHDVVVVGINHRLNVFGYLYLAHVGGAKYADSGNVGMMDIVLALQWTRDNVANFGGDPANVTIFGQSGGGSKVSNLMAMPSAKGLFHKAIVESGSALRMTTPDVAARSTDRLLKHLNVNASNIDQMQSLPMERLIAAAREVAATGGGPLTTTPVVDGRVLTRHPFDPDAPATTASVPMLIGTNVTETTLLIGARQPETFKLDEAGMRSRLKAFFMKSDAEIDRLVAVYRKNRPAASPSHLFFIITSDRTRLSAITQAERKVAQGTAPAYMYLFAWETPVLGGRLHTPHDTEMLFVFDNVHTAKGLLGTGPDLQPLADSVSNAWVAFARTGNPSQPGLAWPAYTASQRETMVFNRQSKVVNDPSGDERVAVKALL